MVALDQDLASVQFLAKFLKIAHSTVAEVADGRPFRRRCSTARCAAPPLLRCFQGECRSSNPESVGRLSQTYGSSRISCSFIFLLSYLKNDIHLRILPLLVQKLRNAIPASDSSPVARNARAYALNLFVRPQFSCACHTDYLCLMSAYCNFISKVNIKGRVLTLSIVFLICGHIHAYPRQ